MLSVSLKSIQTTNTRQILFPYCLSIYHYSPSHMRRFFIAISTLECYGMLATQKEEAGTPRPKFVPMPPTHINIANLP